MEVTNKETGKKVNLICKINGQDISFDVIDNSIGMQIYTEVNKKNEAIIKMTSEEIKYWSNIFMLLEQIELFKVEIENKYANLYESLNEQELCIEDNFCDLNDRVNFVYQIYSNAYLTILESK